MTIALITIVFVVTGGWLLYREPPKQRPGQALSKFDRLAQKVHELIQGRWYGKVAATAAVIVAGLLASTLFSSEPLTASIKTVTVTVTTPGKTVGSTSTPTTTTTPEPEPEPNRSVLGSWTGIVVDQDDTSRKYRITLLVRTTKIEADPAGTLTERTLSGGKCEYLITATGQEGNVFTFASRDSDEYGYGCDDEKISVERKANGTIAFKSDLGDDADAVGTLRLS
jgi:hypothetical protein